MVFYILLILEISSTALRSASGAGQARNDVLIVAGSAFETTLFILYRQALISYAALRFATGHN
jgi:hypothetical protein